MYIKEMLSRNRNDFTFICACEHCGHEFKRGDGYADSYFQLKVIPGQHCPKCRTNAHGEREGEDRLGLNDLEATPQVSPGWNPPQ